jgi:hypothetical protein
MVLRGLVRRHPLIAFFVLAYLLTWWIYPLLKFSPLLGIFGLFGPALAAIIMAAVTGGKAGVKTLLSRVVRWRVGLPWYAIALGLPTILSIATAGLSYLLGASDSIQVGALTVIELVLFVLVVGEELGLARLRLAAVAREAVRRDGQFDLGCAVGPMASADLRGARYSTVRAAPDGIRPPDHRVLDLVTWVFLHTLGSVLIATVFHGAINLSQGIFLGGVDGASRYWLLSIVYGVAALVAAVVLGLTAARKRAVSGPAPVEATMYDYPGEAPLISHHQ